MIIDWLFWGAWAGLFYTYLGFPLLLALRGSLPLGPVPGDVEIPHVSFIIAAYNEADVITEKLDNVSALVYPRAHIEVIVASDGSDDGTDDLVATYSADNLHLLSLPRQGKNATLNEAVQHATGDILVFSDADSMLTPDALRHLVAPFSNASVGGVGGDFHYTASQHEGTGERTYWGFDRLLKRLQCQAGSMTSATGQLYAIRREHFVPIPPGVTDDFFTSAQVHIAHQRLVFSPRARAYSSVAGTMEAEFHRKVRVMTGGLRGVWSVRQLLNPFRYGFYAVQLLTHKILRRCMILPLSILGLASGLRWHNGGVYQLSGLVLLGLLGAGGFGLLWRKTTLGQLKIFSLPLFFLMVNAAFIVALIHLMGGARADIWTSQRAVTPSSSLPASRL